MDLEKFADKKFGQNFLQSDYYKQKIIQSMPKDELKVAEIGPGLGDLTRELIKQRRVVAFEVDKRLCEHLNNELGDSIRQGVFELRCGDVLERWEQSSLLDEPYHLIANLPYYISTTIILKALKDPSCQSILVMVQKEVALKFAAKPKEREFCALAVLAANAGEAKICFDVEPEAFIPVPKVISSVLLIEKVKSENNREFEAFLKVAFKQPRKKLLKNLATHYSKDSLEEVFKTLNLDTNIRPHEATTFIYNQLFKTL
ncbi:MAG: 16S rRNA (adenine(1518)-N(6)/adenine(1519)-N(6))-dimethyltransferase RsmA [Campylobacterales bacterium]|nr:16S rRNA (adenine(1518)-N(6)/adenine(1519)-N(6))-dimethyltransferase RsmA [Campylobacterales bacterium]